MPAELSIELYNSRPKHRVTRCAGPLWLVQHPWWVMGRCLGRLRACCSVWAICRRNPGPWEWSTSFGRALCGGFSESAALRLAWRPAPLMWRQESGSLLSKTRRVKQWSVENQGMIAPRALSIVAHTENIGRYSGGLATPIFAGRFLRL